MFRPHYRVCYAAFFLDFASMSGLVAVPFFVFNQLGGSVAMSGYVGAAQSAAYAAVCLLSAPYVSRAKNALNWAVFGVSGFILSYCAIPFFRNPLVCGTLATMALGSLAFAWPALISWIGSEADATTRGRHMARFNISWSFGFAVAPLFAGPLYDWKYWAPFILLAVMGSVVLTIVRTLPHEKEHFAAAAPDLVEKQARHNRESEAYLYVAWCACMVGAGLASVTRSVYPKRVDELVAAGKLTLFGEETPMAILTTAAATKYSWLAFALAGTTAATFLIMGRTHRWHHRFGLLCVSQLAAGGAYWALANTTSLAVMLCGFIVIGANCAITYFSSIYYSVSNAQHKHRRAAVHEGVIGAGGLAGSLAFGYLAGRYGFAWPFRCVPAFIAVALIVEAFLLWYGKTKFAHEDDGAV